MKLRNAVQERYSDTVDYKQYEGQIQKLIDTHIESGEVQAFVAQPLYEEAQTSVIALDTLLRGNSYPFFTSLDAPLVTRANMDRYRKLLQDVNNWYA